MAKEPIYQFYSELADFEPKIWRRFQVAGNIDLAKLGYIVMTLYEMKGNHLFTIDYPVNANLGQEPIHYEAGSNIIPFPGVQGTYYHFEIPSGESFPDNEFHKQRDATGMILKRLSAEPGLILSVMYDLGDGWEIKLRLETVFTDEKIPARALPRVLEGEGFGIIEDCGGPGGLEQLANAFKVKRGEEYESFAQWLGQEDLDLTVFDLDDMNFRLKKVPRIFRDLYEYDLAPSDYSLRILERRYLR